MSLSLACPPAAPAVPALSASRRTSITGSRVLIADPDRIVMTGLAQLFEREGLQVCRCDDLPHLRNRLASATWDVLVLDPSIGAPDVPALFGEIARLPSPPALIVTSPGMTEVDRIIALEMGADHCVPKPCSPAEMLARIRALLGRRQSRRPPPMSGQALFADLAFDPLRRLLRRADGSHQRLSASEADLLALFLRNPRTVLSRTELLACYPGGAEASDRSLRAIDVLVSRLRAELGSPMQVIVTLRGRGYMLAHDVRWD